MINLKKNDAIADAVRDIMEKELKGNQTKLDKNHNGKLDSQDFKILRGQKKATEDVEQIDELKKSTLASYAKKAGDESSYYSFAAGSRSAKDPQRLISDKLAMKRQSGANKAIDRLSKESTDVNDRSEDTLAGRIKTKKKDDVGPGADFKSTKVDMKSEETVEENAFDYKSPRQPEPNGGSGVKKGTRYGGSKQKEKPEQEEPKEKKEEASYFKERLIERAMLKMAVKKAIKAVTGGSDEDQRKNLQKKMGVPETGKKPEPQKEEVESLEEGKMDKMTLSGLWHKHAQHSYWSDQGYGSGTDSPRHSGHAATAIENHVRKHHGNKVADDMVSHSDHHVAYHEYAGPEDAPHHEKEMAKLKKKHGISDKDLHESAPPGFEGTVKAMKKHKDIDNPFALAWSMKNKGYKSHKKADGSDK